MRSIVQAIDDFDFIPSNMRISSSALWILTNPVVFVVGNVVNVHAPAQVPSGASKPVPHDFASFSFPFHFFPDFAGMY